MIGGVILAIATVVVLGVWKEWGDSFGLGHLEAADFLADVLGVAAGFVMATLRFRNVSTKTKYRVQFKSMDQPRQSRASHSRPAGPRLRSKIKPGGPPTDAADQ